MCNTHPKLYPCRAFIAGAFGDRVPDQCLTSLILSFPFIAFACMIRLMFESYFHVKLTKMYIGLEYKVIYKLI